LQGSIYLLYTFAEGRKEKERGGREEKVE
jgi:hypothetical protein